MKKYNQKALVLSFFFIILIVVGVYFYTINKNTYLKCFTPKIETFYMEIDRPFFAHLYDDPTFIDNNWYTRYNKIRITDLDIYIQEKDEILGNQFPYNNMRLNRSDLGLYEGYQKIGF